MSGTITRMSRGASGSPCASASSEGTRYREQLIVQNLDIALRTVRDQELDTAILDLGA
jgi:hypothetical protein